MVRGGIEEDDSLSLVPSFGRNEAFREPALVGGPRRGTLLCRQPLPFQAEGEFSPQVWAFLQMNLARSGLASVG